MMLNRLSKTFATGAILGASALALAAAPPFAKPAPGGKSLVVPADDAAKGTVYHALSGRDQQIFFQSDAPLEKIKGGSNQVIGYAVAGRDSPANLQAGEWQLPVKSIRTGIELRDEHLAGKDWLDAESHADIVFQVSGVKSIKEARKTDKFSSYTATLTGDMTIHGVTRPLTITGAAITLLPASEQTAKIAKGDLMSIRATYSVSLSDYEVSHAVIGDKVANDVEITTTLYLSTVKPEDQ